MVSPGASGGATAIDAPPVSTSRTGPSTPRKPVGFAMVLYAVRSVSIAPDA